MFLHGFIFRPTNPPKNFQGEDVFAPVVSVCFLVCLFVLGLFTLCQQFEFYNEKDVAA